MWIKELRGAIAIKRNTELVLMNVPMMPPAHRQQVGQRGFTVLDPMPDVVRVADGIGAPGKTAALSASS